MATLELTLSKTVRTAQPETAWVHVEGAPAGASVNITLKQVQGKPPFWGPQTQQVTADASGGASASFSVTFNGPTRSAMLKATAKDSMATYYGSDACGTEVLP